GLVKAAVFMAANVASEMPAHCAARKIARVSRHDARLLHYAVPTMTTKPSPDTLCAQGPRTDDSALVPPIVYSATFTARDAEEFGAMASQPRHARYYTRYGNPLHEQVAGQLVALEGG